MVFLSYRNFAELLRKTYRTGFTDNRNLNLTRISHFILNFFRDFSGQTFSLLVVNLVGTYNYA